jgi:hypothetical protein
MKYVMPKEPIRDNRPIDATISNLGMIYDYYCFCKNKTRR